MSLFVPVSSRTCGIYRPSEVCDLKDEGRVEWRNREEEVDTREGGSVQRWLMPPSENLVAVGELNSLIILVYSSGTDKGLERSPVNVSEKFHRQGMERREEETEVEEGERGRWRMSPRGKMEAYSRSATGEIITLPLRSE